MGQFAEVTAARLLVPAARSSLLWGGAGSRTTSAADLFGVGLSDTTVADASRDLVEVARAGRRTRVVFANAHVINELATRSGYGRVVATADRVYADGSGMALAARLAGTPLRDNVNGTDLFPRLAADAAAAGQTIFLLGGRPGTAAAARMRMDGFGLGASIVGSYHGFFEPGSAGEDAAIAAANASGAQIVLVGMGVPLQDEWIARVGERLTAPVRIGVGGLFDYFAGHVSRAPHVFRVIGCEWVWRLALEPRRMAKRYLIGNAMFVARALVEAVRLRRRAAVQRPVQTAGNLSGR
jgi:exopolysaccharide biosynthesis WecB/TagA/CpsF family protein